MMNPKDIPIIDKQRYAAIKAQLLAKRQAEAEQEAALAVSIFTVIRVDGAKDTILADAADRSEVLDLVVNDLMATSMLSDEPDRRDTFEVTAELYGLTLPESDELTMFGQTYRIIGHDPSES